MSEVSPEKPERLLVGPEERVLVFVRDGDLFLGPANVPAYVDVVVLRRDAHPPIITTTRV